MRARVVLVAGSAKVTWSAAVGANFGTTPGTRCACAKAATASAGVSAVSAATARRAAAMRRAVGRIMLGTVGSARAGRCLYIHHP